MQGVSRALHELPLLVLSGYAVVEVAVDYSFLVAIYDWDDAIVEQEVLVEAAVSFRLKLRRTKLEVRVIVMSA